MHIFSKWIIACLYTVGIFAATPYLPQLFRFASSRWSKSNVLHFVLEVKIIIVLLILAFVTGYSIYKRKKSAIFIISIVGIFLLSFIIYHYIPDPNEFTHLPEYAILCMLMVAAFNKRKKTNPIIVKNSYFLGGLSTGLIGIGDEIYQYFLPNRYFNVYDIFLNILGGILGLLIIWGIKR